MLALIPLLVAVLILIVVALQYFISIILHEIIYIYNYENFLFKRLF
jgi:hypothetical protein